MNCLNKVLTLFLLYSDNFRLFSDGGNFCPIEVSDFQKTIENLSKMIDDSECQILVEMEGMEANRSDQASRITIEFEDR